ncbi:homogentisate 1,2-dioxygenase [Sphingomonas sp.]|uniref:homogentisate 1,2-dioxygenase n=1 Tax=Sphingomonas sp. TaxID=28214 RepID=UPI002ED94A4C
MLNPALALALPLAQAPTHALADHAAAQACSLAPVIPAELAGWEMMAPVVAGAAPATIRIGQGARATLVPGASVTYAPAPAKPGATGTSGGVFVFDVATAGRYRVALGAGAWIDVVRGNQAVASIAHGHGPACSPVKKTVDFDLTPDRYRLQVAGSPVATLPLMIASLR